MAFIDQGTNYLQLPSGTTAQRPTGTAGYIRYNSTKQTIEFYTPALVDWVGFNEMYRRGDGTTSIAPAPSGYYIAQYYPSYSSGTYYIRPAGSTTVYSMYVDMSADGGGYDYYACTGCTATSYRTDTTGCPTGLDYAVPRTGNHWASMWSWKADPSYYQTMPGIYKTGAGGNYTACLMRNPSYYGTGCSDWRVADGGKWWLRDSTYSEPNGDYSAYGWLSNRATGQTDALDRTFNDAVGGASTGTNYLCSTNAKP